MRLFSRIRFKHIFLFSVIVGVAVRFITVFVTHPNFDMESFYLVGKIVTSGQNVYAETYRYNYAPLWSFVLGFLYTISHGSFSLFRLLVSCILITVDVGIAVILASSFSYVAGILFILNPISILLTGSHGQFDNLAFLIGFAGAYVYGNSVGDYWKKRKIGGILLLSLSLLFKHIFFVLPFWWALRTKGVWNKIMTLCIPYGIFFCGFISYWPKAGGNIIENVILYKSGNNPLLYPLIIAFPFQRYLSPDLLFIGALFIGGILARKMRIIPNLLICTGILVLFAPAAANQYFAIIIPLISTYLNPLYIFFTATHAFHIISRLTNSAITVPFLNIKLSFYTVDFRFTSMVLFSGFLYTILHTLQKNNQRNLRIKHLMLAVIIPLTLFGFTKGIEYMMVRPIHIALKEKNYEYANRLFTAIQIIPPLPDTPFYNTLTPIRQEIEKYRQSKIP